jgi:hypothetical protein
MILCILFLMECACPSQNLIFKFYLYLPITHFFLLAKAERTAYNPPG